MSPAILIAISFSFGFFIESAVGFGGGLLAYSILAFFIDLKIMVLAGLYIGTCSSAYIFFTGRQHFDKEVFKSAMLFSMIGALIGAFIFGHFSSKNLALILGILMIFLSIKTMFFDNYAFPKFFKNKLILTGGISHGAFGVGGPFWVNALKKDLKNKSTLRANMAAMFVFFNLVRVIELSLQKQIDFAFLAKIWWMMIPVGVCIYLGFKVHNLISESMVKKAIAIITAISGIKFLTVFYG